MTKCPGWGQKRKSRLVMMSLLTPETGHRLKFMGTGPSLALTSAKGSYAFRVLRNVSEQVRKIFRGRKTGAQFFSVERGIETDRGSSRIVPLTHHRGRNTPLFPRKGPNDFEVDFEFLFARRRSRNSYAVKSRIGIAADPRSFAEGALWGGSDQLITQICTAQP
jgi:hypothetical protein